MTIRNIDIGKAYDDHYVDAYIHYESLEKLAEFFGRNMKVHHHDRFYQIHLVLNGMVRVHLDESSYNVEGPMFFLTPPSTPHSFVLEEQVKGHVLTIRQQLVWELLGGIKQNNWSIDSFLQTPICIKLSPQTDHAASRLLETFKVISEESQINDTHHDRALNSLLQLALVHIARLSGEAHIQQQSGSEFVRIFHHFNALIEDHYKQHKSLKFYAENIGVTEARLNEICRQLAGLSSKNLVNERLKQEACRLLRYSSSSITEIGYELGFKDTAYFARFFRRHSNMTASEYREHNTLI